MIGFCYEKRLALGGVAAVLSLAASSKTAVMFSCWAGFRSVTKGINAFVSITTFFIYFSRPVPFWRDASP